MFDLTQAIRAWRKKMQAEGRLEDGDAEELEAHLRDRVEDLVKSDHSEEQALILLRLRSVRRKISGMNIILHASAGRGS